MSKVTFIKKINDQIVSIYPKTSADNVLYDENTTIKEVIDQIILEIKNLEKVLSIDSVYMKADDGETLLDDGSGNNLVAVASLVAEKDNI